MKPEPRGNTTMLRTERAQNTPKTAANWPLVANRCSLFRNHLGLSNGPLNCYPPHITQQAMPRVAHSSIWRMAHDKTGKVVTPIPAFIPLPWPTWSCPHDAAHMRRAPHTWQCSRIGAHTDCPNCSCQRGLPPRHSVPSPALCPLLLHPILSVHPCTGPIQEHTAHQTPLHYGQTNGHKHAPFYAWSLLLTLHASTVAVTVLW